MAFLSTTRNYDDGEVLTRADLDAFLDDIEAFVNVTKINDDNIQTSGITGSTKLLNQSVTAAKLASNSVTTAKIIDENVTTAKLADASVTTEKLAAEVISGSFLANNSITLAMMTDDSVGTDELIDDSVTNDKIADNAVDNAQIADDAVRTAEIQNAAVTRPKLSTYWTLADTTVGSGTGNTTVDMGTITTTGRPVRIMIYDGAIHLSSPSNYQVRVERVLSGSPTTIDTWINNGGSAGGDIDFEFGFGGETPSALQPFNPYIYVDSPAAGTYTYRVAIQFAGTRSATAVKTILEEL